MAERLSDYLRELPLVAILRGLEPSEALATGAVKQIAHNARRFAQAMAALRAPPAS